MKKRWEAIAAAMESSLTGVCLLTGFTSMVWLHCFPESAAAEWTTLISCSAIFLCVVFAAIAMKAPPHQNSLLSDLRGPWAVYMLIAIAVKTPSPWWAYFIAAIWVLSMGVLLFRKLLNRNI